MEEKTITVPVMREEIVVERRTVTSSSTDQQAVQQDARVFELGANESICIPLRTEQIFIEKRPVIAEEIIVSKRNIEEIRRYTDIVQREEARLERQGKVTIHGDPIEEVPAQN